MAIERQYSASAKEREMKDCFLNFQETREFPRNTQQPMTLQCVSGHDAQSKSQNSLIRSLEEDESNIPWLGAT